MYVTEEEMTTSGLPMLGKDQKLGKTHMGCGCLALILIAGYAVYQAIMWLCLQTS